MDKQVKLSIIIPVYNVEKYVGNTLNSIACQKQNLFDYEVIVVDDGTPDCSMKIVESYKKMLPHMRILSQENQGLSSARNAGMKLAKGQYIWFVDSDDTITDNAFEIISDVLSISNADIIGFSVNKIRVDTGKISIEPCLFKESYKRYYHKDLPGVFLHSKIHSGLAQRYIYNRCFLLNNDLQFYPGIYFEDDEFLVRAKCLARSIFVTDKIIYNYLEGRAGSIMSTFRTKHLLDVLTIIDNFKRFKDLYVKNLKIANIINGAIFNELFWLMTQNDNTVNGYSLFMKEHKCRVQKMTISSGIKSMFPLTLRKIKRRLIVVAYLLKRF